MYKNAQLEIILATMARRRDLSYFEGGVWKERAQVCVSPDLNPIENFWEILERFLAPSTKHQIMEFVMEEWCGIPQIEFQTLVESMLRCIEAVLLKK